MAASELAQVVTAAGFLVVGTPFYANIYDHGTTVILARNAGISIALSAGLHLGEVISTSTAVAAQNTAAAYATSVLSVFFGGPSFAPKKD